MVSVAGFTKGDPGERLFRLEGLSSDEKPGAVFEGAGVLNGSLFFEVDSGDVFMFDAENELWVKQDKGLVSDFLRWFSGDF